MRRINIDTGRRPGDPDPDVKDEEETWHILTPCRTKKAPAKLGSQNLRYEVPSFQEKKPNISAIESMQPNSLDPFEIVAPEHDLLESPRKTPEVA